MPPAPRQRLPRADQVIQQGPVGGRRVSRLATPYERIGKRSRTGIIYGNIRTGPVVVTGSTTAADQHGVVAGTGLCENPKGVASDRGVAGQVDNCRAQAGAELSVRIDHDGRGVLDARSHVANARYVGSGLYARLADASNPGFSRHAVVGDVDIVATRRQIDPVARLTPEFNPNAVLKLPLF